jgi:hypothetical protein
MKPHFLSFGWMLAALIAVPALGQTIVPNPRPGAVLWTKTVTNMQSGAALYLTADEQSVVTATFSGPVFSPLSINLSTQTFGTLGDSERLAGKLVTLSDGGMVNQPDPNDVYSVTRKGSGGWSVRLGTTSSDSMYPSRLLATKRDTLFSAVRGNGNEGLLELNGVTGSRRTNTISSGPPSKLWGSPAGFAPNGTAIFFAEDRVLNGVYRRNALYLANTG